MCSAQDSGEAVLSSSTSAPDPLPDTVTERNILYQENEDGFNERHKQVLLTTSQYSSFKDFGHYGPVTNYLSTQVHAKNSARRRRKSKLFI